MAVSLQDLLRPKEAALLAMEARRGSVGDLAPQDYPAPWAPPN
ncbi:MAG TPA: hypothetical protein VN667_05150 [Burkholderiales bacterium]|nr:hypothetical protein [Burkholderiales bacterium]